MKKFILPIAAVVAGVIAAIGFIALKPNKVSADKPNPPDEIPSGYYYVDGDPANDNLYLVVEGKTIHFESSGDLREAIKAVDVNLDERYLTDEEALERQVDITMADWGDDSYTYTLKNYIDDSGDLFVMFRIAEDSDGIWDGQGLSYSRATKTIRGGHFGDFVLLKETDVSNETTDNESNISDIDPESGTDV